MKKPCLFAHTDRDGVAVPAAPGLLVCHTCSDRIRRDVDTLETLYQGATDVDELIPSGSPDSAGARTVAGPRSPAVDALLVHSDARSTTGPGQSPAALASIAGWARLIREDRSLDVPRDQLLTTVPAGRVSMARELQTIRFHWDWVMAQPWLLDFAAEVGAVVHALKLVRRLDPPTLRIGRCPVVAVSVPLPDGTYLDLQCGALLKVRTDASEIRCRNCDTVWARSSWRDLGSPWADYAHLSAELGVPVGTLWRWASKDRWQVGGTRARRLVLRADALDSYEKYKGRSLGETG